jgi:Predicted methyltransferase regulatory domain
MPRGVRRSTLILCLPFGQRSSSGSLLLLENFSPLMLHDEARPVFDRFDEPLMRELVKDICIERQLRQDVFVRGARRLSTRERDASLGEVTLALACPVEQFVWGFEVPVGKATIGRGFFGPIVAALAEGPKRVCDLFSRSAAPRQSWRTHRHAGRHGPGAAALGPARRAGARCFG